MAVKLKLVREKMIFLWLLKKSKQIISLGV
jgi:hypothetical protein